MNVDALAMPLVPDFMEYVEGHFRRELDSVVIEWSRCTRVLAEWENQHLLDHPAPELMVKHKEAVARLLRFGKFLLLATEQFGASDEHSREIVRATQTCLQDKLALWHNQTLADPTRSEILQACFDEP
jgi:hypothetical protein